MLNRIREFSYKQPAATAVIAFLLIGVAFFRIYQTANKRVPSAPPQAVVPATPNPSTAATAPGGVPAPSTPPTSGVPLPPGVGGTPRSPSGGLPLPPGSSAANGAAPAASAGAAAGRPDPFEAPAGYVFVGSGPTPSRPAAGGSRSGAGLPPVPPLPPGLGGGPGTSSPTASAPPAPLYRLTGVLGGPRAVAILVDKDGSHIVSAGDVLAPGVRVLAIDPLHGVVQLDQYGSTVEVRLAAPAG